MRNTSPMIEQAKKFDLKDFNNCLLTIWSLAIEHHDKKLAFYMDNMLQFLKYIASGDYPKAKSLKPLIIIFLRDVQDRSDLSLKCYEDLTLIIDDLEQNCQRLFQVLNPPIGKKYLDALKAKIAKSTPKELAPYSMQSGNSSAFMLEVDAEIQVYLFFDGERGKQLALMNQFENQITPEAKTIYKSSLLNTIEILFKQIRLLDELNEDDGRRYHLIDLLRELWGVIGKLYKLDRSAYCNYVMHANNTTQQLIETLKKLDSNTYEEFLQKAINGITKMKAYDASTLYELSLLKLKMARQKIKENKIDQATGFYREIVSNLMQCIELAESTPGLQSDIPFQEFICARKLDLTRANLSFIRLTSSQDESKQVAWNLIAQICSITTDYIKGFYVEWQKQSGDQKLNIRDTLESMLDLCIQIVDEMLNVYVAAAMNSTANINVHAHNSDFCAKEIACLENFMKEIYPKLICNDNNNNNTASGELVQKFSALKLKFLEERFKHVESLIAIQNALSTVIVTNLGAASVLLSKIKDAELSTHADLKARKQCLQSKITELKGEALRNSSRRTKPEEPTLPPGLSFLNSFLSNMQVNQNRNVSNNNNVARQSSVQNPENKPQTQNPHRQ